jgi:DNA-directed RNA polymerase alpha subunit
MSRRTILKSRNGAKRSAAKPAGKSLGMVAVTGRPVDSHGAVEVSLCDRTLADLRSIVTEELYAAASMLASGITVSSLMAESGGSTVQIQMSPSVVGKEAPKPFKRRRAAKGTPLKSLKLLTRSLRSLLRSGVTTVQQLKQMTPQQLLRIRGFGVVCLLDVQQKLRASGSSLKVN